MPKKSKLDVAQTIQKLRGYLTENGPATARQAAGFLGVSQPSFWRASENLKDNDDALVVGQTWQTRYALKRQIPDVGSSVPVYEIDQAAQARVIGRLHAIAPRGFYWESTTREVPSRFYDGLPYFLNDLRPSGFLGRLIPRVYTDLGFPQDINNWSDIQCVSYLARFGWNSIGNLLIGDSSFQEYLNQHKNPGFVVLTKDRETEYPKTADSVLRHGDAGSSAGGEQPKFLVQKMESNKLTWAIVKFSPTIDTPLGRRRADLLIAEHIGHQILKKFNHRTCESELVFSGNRIFLEIQRFDRTEQRGRLGLISMTSLNMEYFGKIGKEESWTEIANALLKAKMITREICSQARWIDLFGALIANSDRHLGNLSFFFERGQLRALAPVYDMLPMLYAPQNEQIIERTFTLPTPRPDQSAQWPSAWAAACEFWERVSQHQDISKEFKQISKFNLQQVRDLEPLLKLLP